MKTETELALRRWWIAELQAITKKVIAEEEKRQARLIRKKEKQMGEYAGWTYNDFHDAYGCGSITEKQFDKFTDILEGMKPEPDDLYREKIALLEELYQEQKEILIRNEQFYKMEGL